MCHLKVENLRVVLSDFELNEVNLSLEKGKVLSLLGASGAGKTTLIQTIAGLIPVTQGTISVNGKVINHLPVHKRKIGMVFQDFALFPHLNVFDNIAFGLRLQKLTKAEIKRKVDKLLTLFGLSKYEKREVTHLSGGEKQRVALARTLAPEPEIILFDEPLSAIDGELRVTLREELAEIQKRIGFTAIFVTHDKEEAFFLADIIGIFDKGRLLQLDTPSDLYSKPKRANIASFLGISNRIKVTVKQSNHPYYIGLWNESEITFKAGTQLNKSESVEIFIKPEKIKISNTPLQKNNYFKVEHINSINYGNKTESFVKINNDKIKVVYQPNGEYDINADNTFIQFNEEDLLIYRQNELI